MSAPRTFGGVLVITGIMAAGKSSVAQGLAERLPRSVHLRGDIFRRMVVSGREDMRPEPSNEALRQLELRYELACTTARGYAEAGFAVVYQDVILGEYLQKVVENLGRHLAGVVVLCPSPEAVAARESGREKRGYGSFTPEDLDRGMRDETPDIGLWLDSSTLSVEETADTILTRLEETRRGLVY